ncbi:MAG: GNAT family N-acetyltransferase [Micavibrio aeruginosavorus]|uniref:GNAT family N-acetyltransferase n=1 Tax=Micavibrio aeruginosavorus TaxID=349221 RepID=A0A7T5UHI5_9BACT|nr:MAG: GNAT family N-acetyltransferase [Micavibrio aeruginosavorus]
MLSRDSSTASTPEMPMIRLKGTRVHLRPPQLSDWHEWAMLRSQNRAFLQPWEPTWDDDCLTEEYFQRRTRRQACEWKDDRAYAFLIIRNEPEKIIGGFNINNVCRGAAQYASLGYWLAESEQGHGYMTESGRLILSHAFWFLKLHRLNAGCLPENVRSRALLTRLGFKEEGFAARYIAIDGLWRDHVLYGLPYEDWERRDVVA